ncbi:MAG TPA: O-antigen ligase family protein, partial [Trueperaceae bacterium]|nr:O-antigen ligase family protein [Trueperaceae bacterium]
RTSSYDGSAGDAGLMALGVGLFLVVQAVLVMFRADTVTRIVYGYLATFYFGNRALSEVWLGPATELGAGTVAPLLLGDFIVIEAALRRRILAPAWLFLFAALTLLPAAGLLIGHGVSSAQVAAAPHLGSFVYQYLVLVRAAIVAVVLVRLLKRSGTGIHGYLTHLGVIFAVLGSLTALIAVVTGGRFGLPGWGVNVYANALAVVGALCGWQAIHRSQRRWLNVALLCGCMAGIVGSGTRLALLALVGVVLWTLVATLVARRLPVFGHLSVGIAVGVLVVGFAGTLIALAGEVNPRFSTIGGIEVTSSTGPAQVLEAIQRESSVRTRLTLWEASLGMFSASPIVGVGWGQWNWLKAEYGATFAALLDPHNGYLWAMAEGGVIGLVTVYGTLVGSMVFLGQTLPVFGVLLALVLETSNANMQKPLFAVLIAVLLALAWHARHLRRSARRTVAEGADSLAEKWPE